MEHSNVFIQYTKNIILAQRYQCTIYFKSFTQDMSLPLLTAPGNSTHFLPKYCRHKCFILKHCINDSAQGCYTWLRPSVSSGVWPQTIQLLHRAFAESANTQSTRRWISIIVVISSAVQWVWKSGRVRSIWQGGPCLPPTKRGLAVYFASWRWGFLSNEFHNVRREPSHRMHRLLLLQSLQDTSCKPLPDWLVVAAVFHTSFSQGTAGAAWPTERNDSQQGGLAYPLQQWDKPSFHIQPSVTNLSQRQDNFSPLVRPAFLMKLQYRIDHTAYTLLPPSLNGKL